MKSIITTNKLRKSFPIKGGFYEAVRSIDLNVTPGEVYGFLGPNGAGKTTTLRMLTTLLEPDSGEITIAGFDIGKEPHEVRKRIGYVSQSGGADRAATGREDLILQGKLYGMSYSKAQEQAEWAIKVFALEDCIDRFVRTYSGGQKRRLDIALGIMHRPDVLFLDEPTTGLDPQNRSNLWEQIRTLKKEGTTVFLTSHYLDEVDALSDRLAIMDLGEIVAEGSPKELKKQIAGDVVTLGLKKDEKINPAVFERFKEREFVREISHEAHDVRFYVDDGEKALPLILRFLDAEKISLQTIALSLPSLNDVFLRKTGRSLREADS